MAAGSRLLAVTFTTGNMRLRKVVIHKMGVEQAKIKIISKMNEGLIQLWYVKQRKHRHIQTNALCTVDQLTVLHTTGFIFSISFWEMHLVRLQPLVCNNQSARSFQILLRLCVCVKPNERISYEECRQSFNSKQSRSLNMDFRFLFRLFGVSNGLDRRFRTK